MKNFSVLALVGLMLCLIILPFAAGCQASPAETATVTQTATATATETVVEKVYEFKFGYPMGENSWQSKLHMQALQNLVDKSDGRITIDYYWGGTLFPSKEQVAAIKSGLTDIGPFSTINDPGEFPVSDVGALPFFVGSSQDVVDIFNALYDEGLMSEYVGKGFQVTSFQATGLLYLYVVDNSINSFDQIKGLKIRSTSEITNKTLTLLGASPVNMASSDLYMSLDRGVVDGIVTSPGYFSPMKLYEVVHGLLDQPFACGNLFVAVNQKTWDSLPPDLQEVVMECSSEWTEMWLAETAKQDQIAQEAIADKGVVSHAISSAELAKLKESVKPVIDDYISGLNSKGIDGQKVIEIAQTVMAGK